MFRPLIALIFLSITVSPSLAQSWGDLTQLIMQTLTGGRAPLQSYFMPNAETPETADRALAIAYVHIEGSAGSAALHGGLYVKEQTGWQIWLSTEGLYGLDPRDPRSASEGFYVTTSTLGPNDPRCCPSVVTRWFIDWQTGKATIVP